MSSLRNSLMYPNKSWNRMGPRISQWFRKKLGQIDRRLTLQFLPPCTPGASGEGIDNRFFPTGCWVVAIKLRRSGMLWKTWVCHLQEPKKLFRQPRSDILRLIRRARNLMRQNRHTAMFDHLDRSIARHKREEAGEQREILAKRIMGTCRKFGLSKRGFGLTRVSMYG